MFPNSNLDVDDYNRYTIIELKVKITINRGFQNLMRQFEIIIVYN